MCSSYPNDGWQEDLEQGSICAGNKHLGSVLRYRPSVAQESHRPLVCLTNELSNAIAFGMFFLF